MASQKSGDEKNNEHFCNLFGLCAILYGSCTLNVSIEVCMFAHHFSIQNELNYVQVKNFTALL